MKKIVIILLAALLITGILYAWKKYKDIGGLVFGFEKFTPESSFTDNVTDLLISGSLRSKIKFKVENHTNNSFTINNIFVAVSTINDIELAKPGNPITSTITINPGINYIELSYTISRAGLIDLIKTSNYTFDTIYTKLSTYVNTDKLGLKIKLKGFIVAEGLTIIQIPIDTTIDI